MPIVRNGGAANKYLYTGSYASKNGETKTLNAFGAGAILEAGVERETIKNSTGIVGTRTEIDGGGVYGVIPTPVGPLPLGAGVKLSSETTPTGNSYEVRGEAARTGAKIGTPFTMSFDVSVGVRAKYTPKKDN